jgi:hypothetical protein
VVFGLLALQVALEGVQVEADEAQFFDFRALINEGYPFSNTAMRRPSVDSWLRTTSMAFFTPMDFPIFRSRNDSAAVRKFTDLRSCSSG